MQEMRLRETGEDRLGSMWSGGGVSVSIKHSDARVKWVVGVGVEWGGSVTKTEEQWRTCKVDGDGAIVPDAVCVPTLPCYVPTYV